MDENRMTKKKLKQEILNLNARIARIHEEVSLITTAEKSGNQNYTKEELLQRLGWIEENLFRLMGGEYPITHFKKYEFRYFKDLDAKLQKAIVEDPFFSISIGSILVIVEKS